MEFLFTVHHWDWCDIVLDFGCFCSCDNRWYCGGVLDFCWEIHYSCWEIQKSWVEKTKKSPKKFTDKSEKYHQQQIQKISPTNPPPPSPPPRPHHFPHHCRRHRRLKSCWEIQKRPLLLLPLHLSLIIFLIVVVVDKSKKFRRQIQKNCSTNPKKSSANPK